MVLIPRSWKRTLALTADALHALRQIGDAQKAKEMAAYHKIDKTYLGVSNPQIDLLVKDWRANCDLDGRVSLAAGLWDSGIHEAQIAAGKLLTQARIKPDTAIWEEIKRWVPGFDAWAVADHACSAGSKRVVADPSRLDEVETWTTDQNMWVRRAALVMTLPWSKFPNPKPEQLAQRDRILSWAATYVADTEWFIQKSVAWWLRSLSKHDPDRVRVFLKEYAHIMKPFAVREASKYL